MLLYNSGIVVNLIIFLQSELICITCCFIKVCGLTGVYTIENNEPIH